MATNAELEKLVQQQAEQIEILSNTLGIRITQTASKVEDRADYIKHGSDEHAAFLGLIEVKEKDLAKAQENQYYIYQSPTTGKHWRLEDELKVISAFPNVDPEKIVITYLRQKINELESGRPPIPDKAPSLHVPLPQA